MFNTFGIISVRFNEWCLHAYVGTVFKLQKYDNKFTFKVSFKRLNEFIQNPIYQFVFYSFFLSRMYLNNLDLYNNALLSDASLIKLTVNITDREVTIVPNMYVTYNNVIRNVLKCLIQSKCLPVWQTESCIHCLTVENTRGNDDYGTTLYGEIINNNDIQVKIEIIRENSHRLMVEVNKYLKRCVEFIINNYIYNTINK